MLSVMSDNRSVSPASGEDWQVLADQVRAHNTSEIKKVLAALEPYVDGSFGAINPAHVRTYLLALSDLGKLWRVFDRPRDEQAGPDEEQVAQAERVVLEARKREVMLQLEKIRSKDGS